MIDFDAIKQNDYTFNDRNKYLTLIFLSVSALITARVLRPSPRGFGTHEQLGLPPCLFFHFTGIPCPSCGLTTSFAHATRLHFHQALITQPFGLIAFFAAILIIPLAIFFIRSRIAYSKVIHARGANLVLSGLVAFYLMSWIYKILSI